MLIVNENFGINAKINCHLPYGVSFNLPSYILSTPKFIFVSSPRIFSSYFGGFIRKENHLKCFIEITSQFLCVLPSLSTGLINLGETLIFFSRYSKTVCTCLI